MAKYIVEMALNVMYEIEAENEDMALDKAFEHWEKAEPHYEVYLSDEQSDDMTEEQYFNMISNYRGY